MHYTESNLTILILPNPIPSSNYSGTLKEPLSTHSLSSRPRRQGKPCEKHTDTTHGHSAVCPTTHSTVSFRAAFTVTVRQLFHNLTFHCQACCIEGTYARWGAYRSCSTPNKGQSHCRWHTSSVCRRLVSGSSRHR